VTIINRHYNYIFIHMPKAAGKSVKQHLALHTYGALDRSHLRMGFTLDTFGSYASERPWLNKILPSLAGLGSDKRLRDYCLRQGLPSSAHLSAQQLRELLGEEQFGSMFSFSFVRNPWDRCLSAYYYLRSKPFHPLHQSAISLSFEDFVDAMEQQTIPHLGQQALWLCDQNGQLLVDFFGRVENINTDMAHINETLRLPNCPFEARTNVSEERDRDYRKHYTEKAISIVARIMRQDIELFDYTY
jgi:hypothetical protein